MTAARLHPTAYADQLDAATADANRHLRATAAHTGGRLAHTHAGWLADQAETLRRAMTDGTARVCRHIGPSPRIAHAAAWAPGVLVCSSCIRLVMPDADEDGTCDRCRRPVLTLHAGVVALGPVLLAYGLCGACTSATGILACPRPHPVVDPGGGPGEEGSSPSLRPRGASPG